MNYEELKKEFEENFGELTAELAELHFPKFFDWFEQKLKQAETAGRMTELNKLKDLRPILNPEHLYIPDYIHKCWIEYQTDRIKQLKKENSK